MSEKNNNPVSQARLERRAAAADIAQTLVDQIAPEHFDPIHDPMCPVDVVMIAGAPWIKEALEKDYKKDESGYKKVGGSANSPDRSYFFRSPANLIHFLKRQNLYIPRGSKDPVIGMACFFDWEDRGKFNFIPDRSGIIIDVYRSQVREVVIALNGKEVKKVPIIVGDPTEKALIGYADLP